MESSAHYMQTGDGGRKVRLVSKALQNAGKKVWIIFRGRMAELELLQRLLGTFLEWSIAIGDFSAQNEASL